MSANVHRTSRDVQCTSAAQIIQGLQNASSIETRLSLNKAQQAYGVGNAVFITLTTRNA
jgi:hypothetical protein